MPIVFPAGGVKKTSTSLPESAMATTLDGGPGISRGIADGNKDINNQRNANSEFIYMNVYIYTYIYIYKR
jgi:hypothetical protein